MSRRKTMSLRPPEGQPWWWMTNTMTASITFRSLGIHSRRILDFLLFEHASHAGRENGNLAATYKQLASWGSTTDDVRKGLGELYATGFVRLTHQGLRQDGGGEPSRYALTWLPTLVGTANERPPSNEWADVIKKLNKEGVGRIADARLWLKSETAAHKRGSAKKQKPTPHLRVLSPLNCGVRAAS